MSRKPTLAVLLVGVLLGGCVSAADGTPTTEVSTNPTVSQTTLPPVATSTTMPSETMTSDNADGPQSFAYQEFRRDGDEGFGSEGEGVVFGLVESSSLGSKLGTCLVLVGTLTPSKTEEGAVSERFTLPLSLTLTKTSSSFTGAEAEEGLCEVSEIEEAGYMSLSGAEVTVGVPYPFFAEFWFDSGPSPLEVIVGGFHGPATAVLEPTVLDSIPSP